MHRCVFLLVAAVVMAATALPVSAQTLRKLPAQALRGELTVTQPPEILLNKKPARLAPGSRIRGADNLLAMSSAIVGQALLVHYTLDVTGNVLDVWVLTPAEAARRPWPSTPQELATWSFNPDMQTWSRP